MGSALLCVRCVSGGGGEAHRKGELQRLVHPVQHLRRPPDTARTPSRIATRDSSLRYFPNLSYLSKYLQIFPHRGVQVLRAVRRQNQRKVAGRAARPVEERVEGGADLRTGGPLWVRKRVRRGVGMRETRTRPLRSAPALSPGQRGGHEGGPAAVSVPCPGGGGSSAPRRSPGPRALPGKRPPRR